MGSSNGTPRERVCHSLETSLPRHQSLPDADISKGRRGGSPSTPRWKSAKNAPFVCSRCASTPELFVWWTASDVLRAWTCPASACTCGRFRYVSLSVEFRYVSASRIFGCWGSSNALSRAHQCGIFYRTHWIHRPIRESHLFNHGSNLCRISKDRYADISVCVCLYTIDNCIAQP